MDDIVKAYLPEAFAFIYVINSVNAGGIQKDRVEKLFEHARQVSLDKQRESSSNCALFVCNKWEQVPSGETDEVRNHIVRKLAQCWPSLDSESQIIYMSATDAIKAQEFGAVTKEFGELMNGIKSMVLKSIESRLQIQWRWLDYLLARIAYHTKAFMRNSSEDRENVIARMKLITDRLHSIERQQGSVKKELETFLENRTNNALSALSKYLKSPEFKEKFSSWTLDDVPNTEESWEVTKNYIQKALLRRLQERIEEWEEKNHVFSDARSSLIRYFQERFSYVEGQLRTLESSVLAGNAASSVSGPLASEDFSVAEKVLIGVTSPIWVPVGLVVLVVSVPVVGALPVKEKLEDWNRTRKYEKDKCGYMAKASQEYLKEAAEEQHLKSFVEEQLKEAQVCLHQVLHRIPQLIDEDKMLCKQLREENRSKKEIEDFYEPLHDKSVQLRDEMALFGIKEVRIMDISCNDLEWQDDARLGTGAFATVYRGTLKIRGDDKPVDVAVKVWNEELNDATASGFLSETEILRKLSYPFIVKFYGAALRKEGNQLKAILVMELCKENLMKHIFDDKSNIPGESSSSVTATRDVIGWAKQISDALEYIHRQGIVHRDLKLENILLSLENVAKVADVGVSKEAKAIMGTMAGTPTYLAPEVMKSCMYDYKADVYSFGIMLWEMWYGKRALLDVGGDVKEFYDKVLEGARPAHVEGSKRPPTGLHYLMQHCWEKEPDNRPDAAKCHKMINQLYQEAAAPS
ncbi:U-box domain-containing protein 35-like [Stylophora pistillata]|uniref:U-box domain-containing protein 35-like n=1 Tax=Stylophora pistillata TaxID=50429 RepID=UPI000C04657B|nr:U-box domain-containing protein 35-like [Stylophora pistillata]XP_022806600.1 U-box domain-containing protein 35-like [Stylophora pistillata]XP_022806601.1 U-box domain-containing protein 35-like [Stylophora pistillata]